MANYCNFKSLIVLKENIVNDPITIKVSAIPKGDGTDNKKPETLEVFADNEKHGVEYLVLKYPEVFTQTLNDMCLDTDMIHLHEYFVLCGTILLSSYWGHATNDYIDAFDSAHNTWKKGAFAKIMKTYKNTVLSVENAVANGGVFCFFLWRARGSKICPKDFKASFDVLIKLYKDLEADF